MAHREEPILLSKLVVRNMFLPTIFVVDILFMSLIGTGNSMKQTQPNPLIANKQLWTDNTFKRIGKVVSQV
jgi:hypothetical protein